MTVNSDEDFDIFAEGGLLKSWTEYWGRRQRLLPPEFAESEVVAGPYPFDIGLLRAGYVPSFPNLEAIVVSASGKRELSQGGFIQLPAGNYKIYYVDRHDRYTILPDIKAVTLDGGTITITCGITYAVKDSILVHNVRNPLDALFKACEAAIRHVIRIHKHDEIIDEKAEKSEPGADGETSNPKIILNSQISNDIKLQVSLSEACRAFVLHNVNILDRQGHSRLLNIREEEAVKLRSGRKEIKETEIRTEIAAKQRLLTERQGAVIEQKAINESQRRQILLTAERLQADLERMRKLPQYRHEEILREIDARSKALESLIQAQAMPGFPRNADDLHLVDKIVSEMPNIDQKPGSRSDNDEELSSTIIELLIPKKKDSGSK